MLKNTDMKKNIEHHNYMKAINVLLIFIFIMHVLSLLSFFFNYNGRINYVNVSLLFLWVIVVLISIFYGLKFFLNNNAIIYDTHQLDVNLFNVLGYLMLIASFLYAFNTFKIIGITITSGDERDVRNLILFSEYQLQSTFLIRLLQFLDSFSLYLMLYFAVLANKKYLYVFGLSYVFFEFYMLSRAGLVMIIIS